MNNSISKALELTEASKKVLKVFDGKGFTIMEIRTVLENTLNILSVHTKDDMSAYTGDIIPVTDIIEDTSEESEPDLV